MSRPLIEPTEEIKTRICDALRIGASLEHAAKYAGISRRTLKRWIERGQSEETGEWGIFWQQIEKAKAELIISLLLKINHAASKNWKAAVWRLEQLCPKLYGKTASKIEDEVDDESD